MHLLITGGAGFIGSNFINYWLKENPEDIVTNFDLMTYCANPATVAYHKEQWGERYRHIQGDIRNADQVMHACEGVDAIVHFAAESHVDRSIEGPRVFVETNVLGTLNLLEAAKAYDIRMHHVSTDEVFGALPLDKPEEKFTEKTSYAPRSPYSASKAGADHLVRAYYDTYGSKVTISNCTNNYGGFMFPEKLLPLAYLRFKEGLPMPVYGNGTAVRDYIHVEDHVRGIAMALTSGVLGETYLFGGDEELSTLEALEALKSAMEIEAPLESLIQFTGDRKGHDPRYAIDFSTTTEALGWKPKYTIDSGMRQMVEWYEANEGWWMPLKNEAYSVAEKYLGN